MTAYNAPHHLRVLVYGAGENVQHIADGHARVQSNVELDHLGVNHDCVLRAPYSGVEQFSYRFLDSQSAVVIVASSSMGPIDPGYQC